MSDATIQGVTMTMAAAECVHETGTDVAADVAAIRGGKRTRVSLLAHCLDGADDGRREGWEDYVAAIMTEAT